MGFDVKTWLRYLLVVLLFPFHGAVSNAEVRLPKLLSDHAVLQRDVPIHIWGWADPGEAIAVNFHAQKRSATTDGLGKWSVYLMPEQAGGPYELRIQGSNAITVSDLLVGDVWFASGQSNMEMPLNGFPGSAVLKNGPQEIAQANLPKVRLIRFSKKSSDYPLDDQDATWTTCTPETAAEFSAVAYLFGREVQKQENIPIGLIDSSWGGTPAAAWVSLDGLSSDASLMPAFVARAEATDLQADMPAIIALERRQDAAAKAANQPSPEHSWHPDPASYLPAGLYNGMVAPATNFTIKGVIWYQGEADSAAVRAPLYERLFPALITDWRAKWHQGNFPFLYVQISSFNANPAENWGIVREAQRRTLRLANTGMAVSIDVGEPANVHPADKQTIGRRLAVAARAIAYGEKTEFSGPIFRQATSEGSTLRVWFSHAAKLNSKGGQLQGIEVAGEDHHFRPAEAHIDGESIMATAPGVEHPVYVRYGWANATPANLFNGDGMPASTFTSEERIPLPCSGSCEK